MEKLLALPSKAEHASWLRAKRRQLTRLLGGFPPRESLEAQTVQQRQEPDRFVETIHYEVEPGETVSAVLLIPRHRTPPLPAVICHHQHAGQYDLGKSEVLGWAGDPRLAYAAELCSRGYITLAADAVCFEERRHPRLSGPEHERFLALSLLLKGLTLQGKMIWDVMRAVDYLSSRSEVDPNRIGMIGYCLGAIETWFTAALEPRIKAAAASCGVNTYAAIEEALANGTGDMPLSYALCVPGILKWGDIPEVISMIAPRPLLILAGAADPFFPLSGAKEAASRAGMLYRRLQAANALDFFISSSGHEFTDEMRQRAYHWFDRWL